MWSEEVSKTLLAPISSVCDMNNNDTFDKAGGETN